MDYWSIFAAALFGGLGGGLGALVSKYIKSHSKNGAWSVIFIPIGFAAGMAIEKTVPLLKKPIYDNSIKPAMQQREIKNELKKLANEINSSTPMMVDQGTQLNNAVAIGLTMRYNYTLIPFSSSEVERTIFEQEMRPRLKNSVCSSDMKYGIRQGVTYEYAYYGNRGNQIAVIKINKC